MTQLSAGVALPGQDASRKMFAIDFRGLTGSADPLDVAQVSLAAKAGELKQVINEIKRFTGHSKVIVVGHSLGGLVGRWYIQRGAGASAYEGDVAALATIDAPNLGSSLLATFDDRALEIDTFTQCLLLPSINKAELVPGSSTLATLNASPLRSDTPRRRQSRRRRRSSRIHGPTRSSATRVRTCCRSIHSSPARSSSSSTTRCRSAVRGRSSHLVVNQLPSTIGLVKVIVSAVNRLQQTRTAASVVAGRPQLALIPAGSAGACAGRPPRLGGVPSAYVLRGTYQNPQGVVTPFDLPVGAATSVVVPPNQPEFLRCGSMRRTPRARARPRMRSRSRCRRCNKHDRSGAGESPHIAPHC